MKTKLIIIGGFLGAGKTTLLKAAAQFLSKQGEKVGLISNDQAEGLVDTRVLSGSGIAVRELAGSCFCCNFDGLLDAVLYLRDVGCNIILAEPVGSCTDLSATLMQPIKSKYNQQLDLMPFSVLVDPIRFCEILTSEENTRSGPGYIYLKQLEEADYIVINKVDSLTKTEKEAVDKLLQSRFPGFPLKWISALKETGLESWLDSLYSDGEAGRRIADVDYGVYAGGEAMMGWYNAEFKVHHSRSYLIPWADFNLKLVQFLRHGFKYENIAVAHIKTYLKSGSSEIFANLTGIDREPSMRGIPFSSSFAQVIVNIRAEADPVLLHEIMEDIIYVYAEDHIQFQKVTLNYLKPGRPEPTYRYNKVVNIDVSGNPF